MNIGLNSAGERIRPVPSGRSHCQFCGAELIAKCGPFVDWHWAHSAMRNCDPWHEHETPWHRTWKNRFPNDWHEVIHKDPQTNERHIADVKCPNGLILEFQNSPMNLEELMSREAFYGSMIWVINVAAQRERLHFFPTHNDERVRLSIEVRRKRAIAEVDRTKGKSDTEQEIQAIDGKKERLWYRLSTAQADVDRHGKTVASLMAEQSSISESPLFSYDQISETVRRQFNGSAFEKTMKEKNVEIVRLRTDVEQTKDRLSGLSLYPKWNGTSFSIIPYPKGTPASSAWQHLKYLRTADGIFAEPKSFGSRTEFLQHAYRSKEFEYLIDLTERIATTQANLETKLVQIGKLYADAKQEMVSALSEKIAFWEAEKAHAEEISRPGSELEKELEVVNLLLNGRRQSLHDHDAEFEFSMQKIDEDESYVEGLIEDEFTSILRYDWSRPKKVWYKSKVPVFLDTGEDCVYRLIDWRLAQRIDKEEFAENLKLSGIIPTVPRKLPARRTIWEERGW